MTEEMKLAFIYLSRRLAYAAAHISKYALTQGVCPVNPYLNFGDLKNTFPEKTRQSEDELLKRCNELWLFKLGRDKEAERVGWLAESFGMRIRSFRVSSDAKEISEKYDR